MASSGLESVNPNLSDLVGGIALAPPQVRSERDESGELLLTNAEPVTHAVPVRIGDLLVEHAVHDPDQCFLAQRDTNGAWRRVSYGQALECVRCIAHELLASGCGPDAPLMISADNSIEHALASLAAMHVGVPVAPISPAYATRCTSFEKFEAITRKLLPGMVYVDDLERHNAALDHVRRCGLLGPNRSTLVDNRLLEAMMASELSDDQRRTVDRAFAAVDADTVAKILFTSGSTGEPKGVINTQRMLCFNQAAYAQMMPFLDEAAAEGQPPVLCDWLPWNHTFGGNFNFNLVLYHGGTLYIDEGRPIPGGMAKTLQNLREVRPTCYFNVPRGFAMLISELEADAQARDEFFSRLAMIFYAGADLPRDSWHRLERLAQASLGRRVLMVSGWGTTETAPCSTAVHWPIERPGIIGNPLPGTTIKLARTDSNKTELRVRGPNVTPGYWRDDAATRRSFDRQGFYRSGDAGQLLDPERPSAGLSFSGRVVEDFKLATGTWVHVGPLRIELCSTVALIEDCVVTGRDRDELGVYVFLDITACRARHDDLADAGLAQLSGDERIRAELVRDLEAHNARHPRSSMRILRALIALSPARLELGEITDKGYINQRAVLDIRSLRIAEIHARPTPKDVLIIPNADDRN